MELSRFFTLKEMTRSDRAERANIRNEPDPEALENLGALCMTLLDPLREALGRPIRVNSGYRGPALNALIGGAKRSQHREGRAADIQAPGMSVLELFKTVIRLNLPFDQLIYEAQSRTVKWVHISHDPARDRRQIMVAEFDENGRVLRYPVISVADALALSESRSRAAMPEVWGYSELPDEPEASPPLGERSSGMERKRRRTKASSSKKKAKRVRAGARAIAPTPASKRRATKASSKRTRKHRAS